MKKRRKKSDIFFFHFSKLPQKRCQGGCRLHCQRPESVFEEDIAEEAAEKKIIKIIKKNNNNKIGQFFYFYFWNCPQKGAQGESVFEEDIAEEAPEKKIKKNKNIKKKFKKLTTKSDNFF